MIQMQLKPGSELQNGKYRIVKMLGQGGFGITYEAVHTLSNHIVAVKEFFIKDVCNRDFETSRVSIPSVGSQVLVDKFRRKFIKEAQMIWGLDHPNIVRVTDVFEENGTAYYVMENLPGGSLSEKVKREGPMPEALAEKYIRQVAEALAYIHSQNTVHLDVKPSNILLNGKGEAVLIDFGISKHYDEAGSQTSSTPVGISKGYAPLEQGREGDVSQFRPSTDIYALGATLYYLVTGMVPPEASIVNEDGLIRPSGLSDRIWHAIEKSMQPRRKDCPQTVAAFLSLLGAAMSPRSPSPAASVISMPSSVASSPVADETAIIGQNASRPEPRLEPNPNSVNGHEWVDLDLPSGLKWATRNVGASSPSDYGRYFAWGETVPKAEYSAKTYLFKEKINWVGEVSRFSKYVTSKIFGEVDGRCSLAMEDDVARTNWGGSWRMPTDAEWEELIENCTWAWTTQDGRNGYRVTSKTNGNNIFLPAAGYRYGGSLYAAGSYGSYWSSSLGSDNPSRAWTVYFRSYGVGRSSSGRCYGFSLRPVSE